MIIAQRQITQHHHSHRLQSRKLMIVLFVTAVLTVIYGTVSIIRNLNADVGVYIVSSICLAVYFSINNCMSVFS